MQDTSFSETLDHSTYVDLPIGCLNLDVLRLIFEHVADDIRLDYKKPHLDHWIRLGHVCHVWRSTLLSMPKLWAREILAFGMGNALDDILPRAHDVPLDLELLRGTGYLPSTAFERIAPLIPRARVLACKIATSEDQRTVLDAISSQPTPAIHTLKLDVIWKFHSGYIPFPDATYATCIQHLPIHQLELRNIFILPPLTGSLTSLSLHCYRVWIKHERLTLGEILTALAHNPRLEKLVLHDAIREPDSTAVLPRVALPSLKSMRIYQDSKPSSYDLLDQLRFPNPIMENAMIGDAVVDTATGVSATLTSALSVHARSPALESPRYLRFEYESDGRNVEIHLERCHHLIDDWKPTAQFEAQFNAHEWQSSFDELSSAIVHVLVESRIPAQVIELSWHVGEEEGVHTGEYWDTCLRPFIATETLFLADFDTPNTEMSGLIAMLDAIARTRSDGPLLPRLHRLVTCDGWTELFRRGQPQLRRALQGRMQMHVPIREIRFLDIGGPHLTSVIGPFRLEMVSAQIKAVVAGLSVSVERQECWEDIDGKVDFRGTEFIFDYRAQDVASD